LDKDWTYLPEIEDVLKYKNREWRQPGRLGHPLFFAVRNMLHPCSLENGLQSSRAVSVD
jgi:hypothetical protein